MNLFAILASGLHYILLHNIYQHIHST